MEFKSFEEMESMEESEVIRYSCALMDRKLELANAVFDRKDVSNGLDEANQISDQLKLLAEARGISPVDSQ